MHEELAKPLNSTVKDKPDSPQAVILQGRISLLLKRVGLLQERVDSYSTNVLTQISQINSYTEAAEALDTFNYEWFNGSLYSDNVLRDIARTLIKQVSPFLDPIELWEDLANNKEVAFETAPRPSIRRIDTIEPNPSESTIVG